MTEIDVTVATTTTPIASTSQTATCASVDPASYGIQTCASVSEMVIIVVCPAVLSMTISCFPQRLVRNERPFLFHHCLQLFRQYARNGTSRPGIPTVSIIMLEAMYFSARETVLETTTLPNHIPRSNLLYIYPQQ